jgi:3-oxoadipate enol-lactonase
MERLQVNGSAIEYQVQGSGEPVLLIAVGLVIDGLARPLFGQPELASRYRLIHYRRRGYAGSSLPSQPLTIAQQAGDAAAVLRHLDVKAAHVAGHSIGALIALQLALDAPDRVHSLALLEPPFRTVPSGQASFERNVLPAISAYRAGDRRKAVESFADPIFGPNWQSFVEESVPGGVDQAVKDMDAFMQDLAAIQAWQFGPAQAAAIRQPVLSLVGAGPGRSDPVMLEGRELLHSWLPQTEDADVPTTHLLQMQDPPGVAHALVQFFSRHPMM